jgi:hypothetical protein
MNVGGLGRAAFSRARAMSTYSASRSIPIKRRANMLAASAVVPEPTNGSSTTSLGLLNMSVRGLTVGWLFLTCMTRLRPMCRSR